MCGIVGYIGPRAAVPIIIDGLRRLEYRGYDSAGLAVLESALGHKFTRIHLLERALTHSSHAHEATEYGSSPSVSDSFNDNEQFEFLGDSVLAFVTSRCLFERYPLYSEGQLSKTRAHLVSARHLLQIANELNLGAFLRLGKGEERSGGRLKSALLVDTLEALVAAVYLDGGLEAAENLVLHSIVLPELERMDKDPETLALSDQKSALQEWLQSMGGPSPIYKVVNEQGPDHDKTFTVELRIGNGGAPESAIGAGYVSRAEGRTKKKAEQKAAQDALSVLRNRHPGIQP